MHNEAVWNRDDVIQLMLWTFAIFLLPGVPEIARLVFVSDKEAHFFFFFWAAIIWTSQEQRYILVGCILAGLGLGIEILQGWMPGRSLDVQDLIVDIIGVCIGFLFRIAFDLRFKSLFHPFQHV